MPDRENEPSKAATPGDISLQEVSSSDGVSSGDRISSSDGKSSVSSVPCPTCGLLVASTLDSCPKDGTKISDIASDATLLERYQLLEPIGEGGMSVIYKARHLLMDSLVAIKLMHARLSSNSKSVKRFQQEAKAAKLLKHPNIITVHDFGILPNGTAFLVMDYEAGDSLAAYIRNNGPLSAEECIPLLKQIASALDHAHSQGVLHRDLKPSNVMVKSDSQGELSGKLVDFGIAKMMSSDSGSDPHPQLTATGETFGSPAYMSPEQCQGIELDQRSDLYSFGCLMYEALTGKPPYEGANSLEVIFKHMNDAVPPLTVPTSPKRVGEGLSGIFQKCMQKDRDLRYADARTMLSDLTSLEEGGTVKGSSALPFRVGFQKLSRRKHIKLEVLAAVSLLVLGFIVPMWIVLNMVKEVRTSSATQVFKAEQFQGGKPRSLNDAAARKVFANSTGYRLISLNRTSITDATMHLLTGNKALEIFECDSVKSLTDQGTQDLSHFKKLKRVSLMNDPLISDASAKTLGQLKELTNIHLNRSPIGDDGLGHLSDLPNLQTLGLSYSKITDKGLAKFLQETEKHPDLQFVAVGAAGITDATFSSSLPQLDRVTLLKLQNSRVTDASIPVIVEKFPGLTTLFLGNTKVTYKGLQAALQLKNLTNLNIKGLPVTQQQIDELQKQRPTLNIGIASDKE